jgi:hypothetical protein
LLTKRLLKFFYATVSLIIAATITVWRVKVNIESFIDDFVDTKIDVMAVQFNTTPPSISEKFKQLKSQESETPENVDLSIQVMQEMIKNYNSYICFQTVSFMLRMDFFSDVPELKKELFLKKISWFMYTMYDVEGKSCGWRYYDDAGIARRQVNSFKESIEEQYSQKIDAWQINQ